jgi:hypothetical protein
MIRRTQDNLDDIFRKKFSDWESEPFSDTKEKIFSNFYSEENNTKNLFINGLIQKITDYKYAAAASIAGLLIASIIFYLIDHNQENNQLANNTSKIELIENAKSFSNTAPKDSSLSLIGKQENTNKDLSVKPGSEIKAESELIIHKTDKEKRIVFLPDSSKVYLNKYSELSYSANFTKGERVVYMQGEVYFDVKKYKKTSFIVYTKISRVEVLGTSFSIKALPDGREEVIVESGRVLFAEKENEEANKLFLTPGMKAYLDPGKPIVNVSSDHSNDLSWKTNKLIFNKAPIKDVIEKIESYFEVKIKLVNPKIFDCHFTGKFEQPGSLEEVLEVLSLSINGSYEIKNKEYILTSKGCN